VTLKSTTFFQPLISDSSDVRLLSESALNVKATDSFSVKISYTAAYDSAPFEPGDGESELEKLDTNLKTSLVFTF
jgi:putative salt-induced outer membrane protein YdiY